MKRKLELTITLSVNVPLYILDEPTAALDMTTVDILHSLLVEQTDAEKTILMSSHLPTDAQLADRIAFVGDSGVVASGSPTELLSAVPKVVHVEDTAEGIAEYVLDNNLFETGAERRGYLRDDVDPETIEFAVNNPTTSVRVTDSTTTNLFNYYVHIAPGQYRTQGLFVTAAGTQEDDRRTSDGRERLSALTGILSDDGPPRDVSLGEFSPP